MRTCQSGTSSVKCSLWCVSGVQPNNHLWLQLLNDDRDRYECKSYNLTSTDNKLTVDASMDARYQIEGDRDKFSVSFEADPRGNFEPNDVLQVTVGGVHVGDIIVMGDGNPPPRQTSRAISTSIQPR